MKSYNIVMIKEGVRPQGRPTKGRKENTMKNLYLVETNASTMIVLHDTEDKTATVLDTAETNTPGFNLTAVEDVSAGEIFGDIDGIEDFLGIDYNNGETPRIIETIENWE